MIVALTLAVFGASIWVGTILLRKNIRAQMVGRDADILHAVALMHQLDQRDGADLGADLEETAIQLNVALKISELKGVIATRLYDAQGAFTLSFPAHVPDVPLRTEDLAKLKLLIPGSRFYSKASLAPYLITASEETAKVAPLLEVNIPLHRQDDVKLLGVAQFVIDGETIAAEFAALDRNLLLQSAAVFVIGSLIIGAALVWSFRRLTDRTEKLMRANEELALAAKTSAVGAVTAHLIHRLSNPLSGLQDFVASRGGETPKSSSEVDWDAAEATTREMQNLVAEIIRLLGEEQTIDRYEISFTELAALVLARVEPAAKLAGVNFTTSADGEGVLSNREAGLTALVLENLVRNAIEATPRGQTVTLALAVHDERLTCEVHDQGLGIPESVRPDLFTPCRSSKTGGHGIGLAICKQLANHLGASLELKHTSDAGSIFALAVPLVRATGDNPLPSRSAAG
jgi:signal transduction histidine kinase